MTNGPVSRHRLRLTFGLHFRSYSYFPFSIAADLHCHIAHTAEPNGNPTEVRGLPP